MKDANVRFNVETFEKKEEHVAHLVSDGVRNRGGLDLFAMALGVPSVEVLRWWEGSAVPAKAQVERLRALSGMEVQS